MSDRQKIQFHFEPFDNTYIERCGTEEQKSAIAAGSKLHVVEKADNAGHKRRYLKGITSGIKTDGHGERMTKSCIDRMQVQANSGEILLYAGQHGVDHGEDLGRLVESTITPTGDWITLYRLYDEFDNVGPVKLEKADTLWKQVNGLPPYEKPLQKGFSIEGYIPESGIVEMSETGQRVIDAVDLDGVLVTPRPSYKSSFITAVYKALDELPPSRELIVSENIRGKLLNKIHDEQLKQSWYSKRFKLEDALNESIEEIVSQGIAVNNKLKLLFDSYSQIMIDLILEHNTVFVRPIDQPDIPDDTGAVEVAKANRARVLTNIRDLVKTYAEMKVHKSVNKEKTRNVKHGNKRN